MYEIWLSHLWEGFHQRFTSRWSTMPSNFRSCNRSVHLVLGTFIFLHRFEDYRSTCSFLPIKASACGVLRSAALGTCTMRCDVQKDYSVRLSRKAATCFGVRSRDILDTSSKGPVE